MISLNGGCKRRNIGGHSLNSHAQKVTYSDAGNYHSGGGERLISFYSPPGVRGVGPSDMTMLSAVSVPVTLHNADPGFGGVSGNLITCDRTIETVGFCSPGVGLARDSFGGGYMTNVTGTGSRAVAVASTTGVAVNVKERRTQRDSWGEDDLEFLRSLAEADCPPPDHGNHPALPQAPVTLYPPQMNSQPQAATMFRTSNLPGIQTAVPSARDVFSSSREPPPVRITAENREAARNFPRQDDNCTTEVTEEEKLHAADYVAMLLWRAGPQLRDRLLSRVNDTWARVERELEAARDAAAQLSRHDRPVAHGAAELALCAGKSFKELLMERLEETQRVVEADLKAADEEAALMGGTATTCKAPQWLGAKALRGDIREKLKQYQTRVRDQKKAEITANAMAAKARGETNDYFVKVLEQTRQELYMQASENGIQPLDHDAKLEEIDRITEGLLEQLDANHRAVQEELTPVKGPLPSNFRDGLLERLNATRAVAKAQLTAADAAAVTSDGVILGYGATVNNVPGVSAPVPVSAVRGLRVMGDVSDESDSLAVHATAGTSGQAQDQADVNTKEDGTPVKKRKRKSGGGRRCKHEGCSLHPHFGFTRPEYCSSHKLTGMFNVKGRRCLHPDCSRTPVYGNAGDRHPTYCAAHKMVDMVDIKNPTCREPTCPRQPSFGCPEDRRATYCASHMLSGMVNVRRMLSRVKSASRVPAARPGASVTPPAGAMIDARLPAPDGPMTLSSGTPLPMAKSGLDRLLLC